LKWLGAEKLGFNSRQDWALGVLQTYYSMGLLHRVKRSELEAQNSTPSNTIVVLKTIGALNVKNAWSLGTGPLLLSFYFFNKIAVCFSILSVGCNNKHVIITQHAADNKDSDLL
jgi:hypothetical protein